MSRQQPPGLNGGSMGKQVNFSNISWLDDHTETARNLEAQYFDNWGNLPTAYGSDGTPYYIPSTYVDTRLGPVFQTVSTLLGRGLPGSVWPVSPPGHMCLGRAATDGESG